MLQRLNKFEQKELTTSDIETAFRQMKKMGYMFRRERVWLAGEDTKKEGKVIPDLDAFKPEYLSLGLSRILIEFIDRRYSVIMHVDITSDNVSCEFDRRNFHEVNETVYTEFFRQDRSPLALFYGEENTSSYDMEIILPEPLCKELLLEYGIVEEDQLLLCRLAAQKKFQDWFESKYFTSNCEAHSRGDRENYEQEIQKRFAEARRIARRLKYRLVKYGTVKGKQIEVFCNRQNNRALLLLRKGEKSDIRFVDRFMNITAILKEDEE